VSLALVGDGASANVVLDAGTTSASGGMASGVLGCFNTATGEITIIEGWDWYAGADPSQIGASQYDFETAVAHELGHALGLGHNADAGSPMHGTLGTDAAHRVMAVADLNIPDPPAGADALTAAGFQADEGSAAPAAVTGDQVVTATAAAVRAASVVGAGTLKADSANVILVSLPGAAPSVSGAAGDRLAPPPGFGQVVARPGVPNQSAAVDSPFFMAGSATPGSDVPGDGTTPVDATEPVLIDTIFRDWGASAQGPGLSGPADPSQAARASRATAVYAAAPASAGAGVSGFGYEGTEAFAAWGVTDVRSGEDSPDAPAWTYGGGAPAGGMLGAVTVATAVAALTERGRPLPGRARAKRTGWLQSPEEFPEQ
jgi:hypothetical protein